MRIHTTCPRGKFSAIVLLKTPTNTGSLSLTSNISTLTVVVEDRLPPSLACVCGGEGGDKIRVN